MRYRSWSHADDEDEDEDEDDDDAHDDAHDEEEEEDAAGRTSQDGPTPVSLAIPCNVLRLSDVRATCCACWHP